MHIVDRLVVTARRAGCGGHRTSRAPEVDVAPEPAADHRPQNHQRERRARHRHHVARRPEVCQPPVQQVSERHAAADVHRVRRGEPAPYFVRHHRLDHGVGDGHEAGGAQPHQNGGDHGYSRL